MLWDVDVDRTRNAEEAPAASPGNNLLGLLVELKEVMEATHSTSGAAVELSQTKWIERFTEEITSAAHFELFGLIEERGGIGSAAAFQDRLNKTLDASAWKFLSGKRIRIAHGLTAESLAKQPSYQAPYTILRMLIGQLSSVMGDKPLSISPSTRPEVLGQGERSIRGPHGEEERMILPVEFDHTSDFSTVRWFGEQYTFSVKQAIVVRFLWDYWERKIPWVHERTLIEEVNDELAVVDTVRLRDLFRSSGQQHPCWGTMIVPKTKPNKRGLFGLCVPKNSVISESPT